MSDVPAIRLEALIAPSGSTVVLRCSQHLGPKERDRIRAVLEERSASGEVQFVLLEGGWEACVIGAPE